MASAPHGDGACRDKCWCVCALGASALGKCLFTPNSGLSKAVVHASLKVGDCATLSSQLSSEPSACHIWLQGVRAERRWNSGRRNKAQSCCEREIDGAVGSHQRGFAPVEAPFCPCVQTGKTRAAEIPFLALSFRLTACYFHYIWHVFFYSLGKIFLPFSVKSDFALSSHCFWITSVLKTIWCSLPFCFLFSHWRYGDRSLFLEPHLLYLF